MNIAKWLFKGSNTEKTDGASNSGSKTNSKSEKTTNLIDDDSLSEEEKNVDENTVEIPVEELEQEIEGTVEELEKEDHVDLSNTPLADISDFYKNYLTPSPEEAQKIVETFKCPNKGDIRSDVGHKKGGMVCLDNKIIKRLRGVGKEIIKEIGKRILTGRFNLTKISFPIKAMVPKSVLEASVHGSCVFPIYMAKAAQSSDKVERMKYVVAATLSSFYWTNTFLKPLNPILGETLQGSYTDGTQVYAEQTSHHPPVSQFLVYGPNQSYVYSGYYLYEAKAGLNSITINNKGKRKVTFKDGQSITYNFPNEYYSGTFLGTTKQESYGVMTFEDKANNIKCEITIGKVKKRPTDYLQGQITQNGKVVSKIEGTYLGYVDFDGERYWDYQYLIPFKIQMEQDTLASDHSKRADLVFLKKGDVERAQKEKENLEELQRKDAKIRKSPANHK